MGLPSSIPPTESPQSSIDCKIIFDWLNQKGTTVKVKNDTYVYEQTVDKFLMSSNPKISLNEMKKCLKSKNIVILPSINKYEFKTNDRFKTLKNGKYETGTVKYKRSGYNDTYKVEYDNNKQIWNELGSKMEKI